MGQNNFQVPFSSALADVWELKTRPPHPKKVLIFATFQEMPYAFPVSSMVVFYLINNKVRSLTWSKFNVLL